MSKQVIAVVVGTLLAVGAASLWVPTVVHHASFMGPPHGHDVDEWRWITQTHTWDLWFGYPDPVIAPTFIWRIRWLALLAQQIAAVTIGGGLLTFVVRRERRRKAAV